MTHRKREYAKIIMIEGILVILLVISFIGSSHEFPITTDPASQTSPAIYQDIVVWKDERNGNPDIYGYNLATGEEVPITTDPSEQSSPAIYGNVVVWEDERNGN